MRKNKRKEKTLTEKLSKFLRKNGYGIMKLKADNQLIVNDMHTISVRLYKR